MYYGHFGARNAYQTPDLEGMHDKFQALSKKRTKTSQLGHELMEKDRWTTTTVLTNQTKAIDDKIFDDNHQLVLEMRSSISADVSYDRISLTSSEQILLDDDADKNTHSTSVVHDPRWSGRFSRYCVWWCRCACCCCMNWYRYVLRLSLRGKGIFLFGLCLLVLWLLAALMVETCYHPMTSPDILPDPNNRGLLTPAEKLKRHFVVHLHGDSLMLDPQMKYGMHDRIYHHLTGYNLTLTNYGRYAESMEGVIDYMNITMRQHPSPDAVIVLSSTDVINPDFDSMSTVDVQRLMQGYVNTVNYIVKTTLTQGTHVALVSPGGVLLEGPFFQPINHPIRFQPNKQMYVLQYRAILQAIAAQFHIPFVDLREPFLAGIYPWRLVYKGCVTRDGEHANQYGTNIMSRLFAQVILQWIYDDLIDARG